MIALLAAHLKGSHVLLNLALALILAGTARLSPLVFPEKGSPFSGQDMARVAQLAESRGYKVWFLHPVSFGPIPSDSKVEWAMEAFLLPDVETKQLRRGRVLSFVVGTEPGSIDVGLAASSPEQYAQVFTDDNIPTTVKPPARLPFSIDPRLSNEDIVAIWKAVIIPSLSAADIQRLEGNSPDFRCETMAPASRKLSQLLVHDEGEVEAIVGDGCCFDVKRSQSTWRITSVSDCVS